MKNFTSKKIAKIPTAITNNILLDLKEFVKRIRNYNDYHLFVIYERTFCLSITLLATEIKACSERNNIELFFEFSKVLDPYRV